MDAATVQEYFLTGIHSSTVKNYDKNFVARAVDAMTGASSVYSVGLSQEIHITGGMKGKMRTSASQRCEMTISLTSASRRTCH